MQAETAAATLEAFGLESSAMWYSTWAKSSQTATIIGEKLQLGFERRLPEYTYLDSRSCGEFEGTPLEAAEAQLGRFDEMDIREPPPPSEDGTPNESVQALAARVQQMLSIIETLASGSDVVVVAGDSDLLSVWQACVAGAPLAGHRAFAMQPGEVRPLEYRIQYADPSGSPPRFVVAPMVNPSSSTSSSFPEDEQDTDADTQATRLGASRADAQAEHVALRLARLDARYADAAERQARGAAALAALGAAGASEERANLASSLSAQKLEREEKEKEKYNAERAAEAKSLRQRQLQGAAEAAKKKKALEAADAVQASYQGKVLLADPGEWGKAAAEYPVAAALVVGGAVSAAAQARKAARATEAREAAEVLSNYSTSMERAGAAGAAGAEQVAPVVSEEERAFSAAVKATQEFESAEKRRSRMTVEKMSSALALEAAALEYAALEAAGLGGGSIETKGRGGSGDEQKTRADPEQVEVAEANGSGGGAKGGSGGSARRRRPRRLEEDNPPLPPSVLLSGTPGEGGGGGGGGGPSSSSAYEVLPPSVETPWASPGRPLPAAGYKNGSSATSVPPRRPGQQPLQIPPQETVRYPSSRTAKKGAVGSSPAASPPRARPRSPSSSSSSPTSGGYYEVVFPEARLGIGLEVGFDDDDESPPGAGEAVFPRVVAPSAGPLNPSVGVGHFLVAVNGVRLDAETLLSTEGERTSGSKDLFEQAVELVKTTGRPISLGFEPARTP